MANKSDVLCCPKCRFVERPKGRLNESRTRCCGREMRLETDHVVERQQRYKAREEAADAA